MTRCSECGGRMIVIDAAPWHPACDPLDPDAALIRSRHAARIAGLYGQTQAATGSPDDFAMALTIIREAACTMRVFSANDLITADPRWSSLGPKVPGAAMGTAARKRYIRKTGRTVPALSAKAHHIPEWESLIYVDEFKSGLTTARAS